MSICIYETVFIANGMFFFASNLCLCCVMHLLSSLVSTSITSHIGFPEALVMTKCHFPEWPLWVPTDLGQGGEKALD